MKICMDHAPEYGPDGPVSVISAPALKSKTS